MEKSGLPGWKIHSFLSEVSVCWSCTEKLTIKIERAFSVILQESLATRRSFQQSLQPPAVAVTSGNSPAFISHKSFPSAKLGSCFKVTRGQRSSPVTAWYNYIIITTFEGLKRPLLVGHNYYRLVIIIIIIIYWHSY